MIISPDKQSGQADTASGAASGAASDMPAGAQRDKTLQGPIQKPGQDRGQPPAGEDVARFQKLSRDTSADKDGTKPGDVTHITTPGQFPSAESILKAMHLLQADTSPGAPPAPPAGAGAVSLEGAAAAIAQRILVSDPDLGRGLEVRIELKQDILPGTEIRISRDAHGLSVQLVTANENSRAFLQDNQGGLVRHLQDRLQDPVQVTVRMENHGFAEKGAPPPGQATGPAPAHAPGHIPGQSTGSVSPQASASAPGQATGPAPAQASGHIPGQTTGPATGSVSPQASPSAPGQATGPAQAQAPGHIPSQTTGPATGPVFTQASTPASGQSPAPTSGQSSGQNPDHDPNQGRSRQQRNVYEEYEP